MRNELIKARLTRSGLCVLALLFLAVPLQAQNDKLADSIRDGKKLVEMLADLPPDGEGKTLHERLLQEDAGYAELAQNPSLAHPGVQKKIQAKRDEITKLIHINNELLQLEALPPPSTPEEYRARVERLLKVVEEVDIFIESKQPLSWDKVWRAVSRFVLRPALPVLSVIGAWLIAPGAHILSYVWITPESWFGLIAAILLSWWLYATALRLAWVVPGRIFGFYSPEQFSGWLKLTIPWRPFFPPILSVAMFWRRLKYGVRASGRWASWPETAYHVWKPGKIFLGRPAPLGVPLFQPVGIKGERHLVMIAGAGSGKTTLLMTMLGMLEGNAFVIDVDGQIINALRRRLGDGGRGILGKNKKVCVLDPYQLAREGAGSSWNPIEEIDKAVERHGRDAAVRFADTLAQAIVKNDDSHQPFFANAARTFIKGLILYVWACEEPERRNIVRVRELLTMGLVEKAGPKDDPFGVLLYEMLQVEDFDGVIARAAGVMASSQGKDGKNHPRSTAIEQTSWLDIPEVAAISQHSDFYCEDLKTGNVCLFIVAPVTDIQTKLSGWARALTMMTMYAFENIPGKLEHPCLFALDEMPSLGRIEAVETAAPVFRKYGIRLLAITQDLEKLRAVYPNTWGGFLGNSEAVIWMGTDHQENIDYLFKILGNTTRKEKIEGSPWWQFWGEKVKARYQKVERPLIYAHQLREFLDKDRGNIIVTRNGKRPMRLKNDPYYRALPVFAYEADRHYGETLPRSLTRGLILWLTEQVPVIGMRIADRTTRGVARVANSYGEHGGAQLAALVVAVLALLLATAEGPETKPADWLDWILGLIVRLVIRVVAGAVGLSLFFWLLRSVLKDAYATASALVAGTFDNKLPYGAYSLKFFSGVSILAVGLVMAVRFLSDYAPGIESTPLRWAIYGVSGLLGLVALVVALLAVAILPPLLYSLSVAMLWPSLGLMETAPGRRLVKKGRRSILWGAELLPDNSWTHELLNRWLAPEGASEESCGADSPRQ